MRRILGAQESSTPQKTELATAVMTQMFGAAWRRADGDRHHDFQLRLQQRPDSSGARVYYAMAKDGLFFRSVAKLHPTYKTPAVSLMVQMVWTCILCISGSYGQLLDYIVFAVLVFYILTIGALFVLRRTHPTRPGPTGQLVTQYFPQYIF